MIRNRTGATDVDLDAAREDLEQVVRESEAAIASLTAEKEEEDGVDAPEDDAEQAADLSEEDREDALIEAARQRRSEALEALARIEAGSYGTCVDCGQPIADARLEYRPEAARCLEDQEKLEAAEA
jgi:DnaK suppressor protein